MKLKRNEKFINYCYILSGIFVVGEQPAVYLEQSMSSTRVPGRGEQLAVCLEESRPSYLDKPNGTIGTNIHDEILICNKIVC